MDAMVAVADFYRGSNTLIGTKRRIEGLALKATDDDGSHGGLRRPHRRGPGDAARSLIGEAGRFAT
jgi:hypothetical protein